jgi:hypothetical protein
MNKFRAHRIIFLLLVCGCCVDPFNTSLPANKALVVDGLVTDQIGGHTVTLSYSSNLGIGIVTRERAKGATVMIIDNTGIQTQLAEIADGTYQTDSAYHAETGKSYFLRIRLNNQVYESDFETLLPAGQLDSLFFKVQPAPPLNQFQFYANSSRSAQGNGLMRWRSSFVFQIVTYPELAADPPPCIDPCTCCICWVSGQNDGVVIANGSDFVHDNYPNHLVATIPIDDQRFQIRYYLKVDQLSLSANAYNFWNLVITQQTGATSLFQPASARIQGNIHSITNPDEQVLGLFQVSSVVSKSIFITRVDVPPDMQHDPPFLNMTDCRNQGTNIRPPFW